jgi:hypothetical protein
VFDAPALCHCCLAFERLVEDDHARVLFDPVIRLATLQHVLLLLQVHCCIQPLLVLESAYLQPNQQSEQLLAALEMQPTQCLQSSRLF